MHLTETLFARWHRNLTLILTLTLTLTLTLKVQILRSVYSHDRCVLSTPVGYSHDDQSEAR